MMRRFVLVRDQDVTGVSGTGKVAEGVLWSDQTVTIKWLGRRTSEVSWPGGVDDVNAVHGHNGATRVVWVDEDYGTVQHPIAAHIADLDRRDHPQDYGKAKFGIDAVTGERIRVDRPVNVADDPDDSLIRRLDDAATDRLRTPDEWARIRGIRILDPDGWRGPGAPAWTQPITELEFEHRLARSTVNHRPAAGGCRCEGGVHVCE